jgi:S-methylmethionine-dependent homocysteine/selenocysteine methylase
VSFTVETDGRLPDGTTLAEAISAVDREGGADWYGVNCAHPTHILRGLEVIDSSVPHLTFPRPNASTMSHQELDEMEVLDAGDQDLLKSSTDSLREKSPVSGSSVGAAGLTAVTSHVSGASENTVLPERVGAANSGKIKWEQGRGHLPPTRPP